KRTIRGFMISVIWLKVSASTSYFRPSTVPLSRRLKTSTSNATRAAERHFLLCTRVDRLDVRRPVLPGGADDGSDVLQRRLVGEAVQRLDVHVRLRGGESAPPLVLHEWSAELDAVVRVLRQAVAVAADAAECLHEV